MNIELLNSIILSIHVLFAVIFIGGSLFIWLVVYPESFKITDDEKLRTRIVGLIGKRFAFFTNLSIIILILTGIYNATWYLNYNIMELFSTPGGNILLAKIIVVAIMLVIMYGNNLYHGKRIMKLAKEGKMEELRRLRRFSHLLSYITLGLEVLIIFLAVSLQFF
ncbi:CopD family protein [Caldiplasma sukawensis]